LKDRFKIELRGFFWCGVVALLVTVFTTYVPPEPTLIQRAGIVVVGAIQIYLFILICRLISKGIVRLFKKNSYYFLSFINFLIGGDYGTHTQHNYN